MFLFLLGLLGLAVKKSVAHHQRNLSQFQLAVILSSHKGLQKSGDKRQQNPISKITKNNILSIFMQKNSDFIYRVRITGYFVFDLAKQVQEN